MDPAAEDGLVRCGADGGGVGGELGRVGLRSNERVRAAIPYLPAVFRRHLLRDLQRSGDVSGAGGVDVGGIEEVRRYMSATHRIVIEEPPPDGSPG